MGSFKTEQNYCISETALRYILHVSSKQQEKLALEKKYIY